MMSTTFITTIEWQIFHNILSKYFITTFFDNIHYHNILRQTLKWQIINRCINEVSQQSISMLNYSTSLLQYLHLNYWVTDSSSDYETVMKQFFITKHLITKHLITKHLITKHLIQNISSQNISSQNISSQNFIATNWVTDISPNSSPNSSSHFFIGPLFTTILSQQLYSNIFITNFNELFLRNIYVIVLQISSSQTFTNSLSQSLSDRCFDKLFTNIQMSYIFHHKHSQTLYHKV